MLNSFILWFAPPRGVTFQISFQTPSTAHSFFFSPSHFFHWPRSCLNPPGSLNCVGLQFRAWGPRQEVTSILREVTAGLLPRFTVLMNQLSLFVTNSDSEVWAGHRGWCADSTLAAYPVCMTTSFLTLLWTARPWLGGDFGWARAFCCCHMHLQLPPSLWLINSLVTHLCQQKGLFCSLLLLTRHPMTEYDWLGSKQRNNEAAEPIKQSETCLT